MRKVFIVLALFLLSFGLFAEKPVVAVWEIDNKTVGKNKLSQYDAELIADLMRDELIQSNEFRVMSKDEMESAIAQHVKKSHQLNKDKNYAIELGKQISARYVVTSWIKTDENGFRMFAEITDTETATTVRSGRTKFVMGDGSKDAAIAGLIRQLLGIRDESARPKKSKDQEACEKARHTSGPTGWLTYLEMFPKGQCAAEAERALDETLCEHARNENTVEIWQKYLKLHPGGDCEFEARSAIRTLQHQNRQGNTEKPAYSQPAGSSSRDAKACKYAQSENSLEAWQDYIDSFPNGECSFEAKGNIRKLQKGREKHESLDSQGRKIGNLIWSDRSSNEMNWSSAKQYCEDLSEGGFNDWRLPTISELKTTIQNCQSGGSLCRVSDSCLPSDCWSKSCYCDERSNNGGYYSKLGDTDGIYLWSSSTQSDSTNFAWAVGFGNGDVNSYSKSFNYYVRCVR